MSEQYCQSRGGKQTDEFGDHFAVNHQLIGLSEFVEAMAAHLRRPTADKSPQRFEKVTFGYMFSNLSL